MKSNTFIIIGIGLTLVILACSADNGSDSLPDLETEDAKFSYAIGLEIGSSLEQIADKTSVDVDILARGIKDQLSGAEPLLDQEEAATVKQTVMNRMQAEVQEERQGAALENASEEEAFLDTNAKREGVITTESGLQYEILEEGQGEKPESTDRVTVHYRGTLLDGTVFDSSYDRGSPATFGVNQVIPGWTEALQLMSIGSKYKLYIPSKLAYGSRGAGQTIGPNACLIFEVELIEIQD
jgi:FKBP-type peptidyl-prolyl cis-trans isomerase